MAITPTLEFIEEIPYDNYSSHTTQSWTPEDDTLYVVMVSSEGYPNADLAASLSGNGITWTRESTVTSLGSQFRHSMAVFYGAGSSTSAGTLTVTFTNNNNAGGHVAILKVAGAKAGNNGAYGIASSATDSGNGTSATASLAEGAQSTLAFLLLQDEAKDATWEAGFTELYDDTHSGGASLRMFAAHDSTGEIDAAPTATFTSDYYGMISLGIIEDYNGNTLGDVTTMLTGFDASPSSGVFTGFDSWTPVNNRGYVAIVAVEGTGIGTATVALTGNGLTWAAYDSVQYFQSGTRLMAVLRCLPTSGATAGSPTLTITGGTPQRAMLTILEHADPEPGSNGANMLDGFLFTTASATAGHDITYSGSRKIDGAGAEQIWASAMFDFGGTGMTLSTDTTDTGNDLMSSGYQTALTELASGGAQVTGPLGYRLQVVGQAQQDSDGGYSPHWGCKMTPVEASFRNDYAGLSFAFKRASIAASATFTTPGTAIVSNNGTTSFGNSGADLTEGRIGVCIGMDRSGPTITYAVASGDTTGWTTHDLQQARGDSQARHGVFIATRVIPASASATTFTCSTTANWIYFEIASSTGTLTDDQLATLADMWVAFDSQTGADQGTILNGRVRTVAEDALMVGVVGLRSGTATDTSANPGWLNGFTEVAETSGTHPTNDRGLSVASKTVGGGTADYPAFSHTNGSVEWTLVTLAFELSASGGVSADATPASTAWTTVPATMTPGSATFDASPATTTWVTQPATMTPGTLAVDADPAATSWNTQTATLTVGALTVDANPASTAWATQAATMTPGSATFDANPATTTWSTQVATLEGAASYWLLEDGTGYWILEDSTGYWLLEDATITTYDATPAETVWATQTAVWTAGGATFNADPALTAWVTVPAVMTPGDTTFDASPALTTWATVPATITPGELAVSADPATTAWATIPATLTEGGLTVDATPAATTWSTSVAQFTGGALVANADPATTTWSTVPATMTAGAASFDASPALTSWATQPAAMTAGGVTVNADPASTAWTTVVATLTLGELTVDADPALTSWATQEATMVGENTMAASPALTTWTTSVADFNWDITVDADPANTAWETQPATLTAGGLTVDAAPAGTTWTTVPATVTEGGLTVNADPSVTAWTTVPATLTGPPSVTVDADPSVTAWTTVPASMTPGEAFLDASPAMTTWTTRPAVLFSGAADVMNFVEGVEARWVVEGVEPNLTVYGVEPRLSVLSVGD